MLGAIAQFETELRAERQMEGIENAKARGVVFGRHKSLTRQQIVELQHRRRQGTLIRTLMRDYRIAKIPLANYTCVPGYETNQSESGMIGTRL
jgi:DNA invertase Pin-like site-specific DNA recombinase